MQDTLRRLVDGVRIQLLLQCWFFRAARHATHRLPSATDRRHVTRHIATQLLSTRSLEECRLFLNDAQQSTIDPLQASLFSRAISVGDISDHGAVETLMQVRHWSSERLESDAQYSILVFAEFFRSSYSTICWRCKGRGSFEETHRGMGSRVGATVSRRCSTCDGTGSEVHSPTGDRYCGLLCFGCQGWGHYLATNAHCTYWHECDICSGRGRFQCEDLLRVHRGKLLAAAPELTALMQSGSGDNL